MPPEKLLTSSRTGSLYFGYGSNLSMSQMQGRCPSSGSPIAVARLNSWFWMITQRGYANIVPVRPTETSLDTDATTVWGIVYNLTPDDERALDRYEGYSRSKLGGKNPIEKQRIWKPFEQGRATYNKLYLPIKIEKWLIPNPQAEFSIDAEEFSSSIVRALVYVDEQALISGRINQDYVRRMGRSARECVALGVPERWVETVLGQHGIDRDDPRSFTDDIQPGSDAVPPPKEDWEDIRQQYLRDNNIGP